MATFYTNRDNNPIIEDGEYDIYRLLGTLNRNNIKRTIFSIYGSASNNDITSGVKYTLKTGIDTEGQLIEDLQYRNLSEPVQSIGDYIRRFNINVSGLNAINQDKPESEKEKVYFEYSIEN